MDVEALLLVMVSLIKWNTHEAQLLASNTLALSITAELEDFRMVAKLLEHLNIAQSVLDLAAHCG